MTLLPCCSFRQQGLVESGFLRHNTSGSLTLPVSTASDIEPLRRKSDEPPASPGHDDLTPYRKHPPNHAFTPGREQQLSFTSPQTTPTSPYTSMYQYQSLTSPRVGVAGEQRSLIQTPKPIFPLNVKPQGGPGRGEDFRPSAEILAHRQSVPTIAPLPTMQPAPPAMENIDYSPFILRARALSVFEEESETESVTELLQHQHQQPRQPSSSPTHSSPPHNPSSPRQGNSPHTRSRWLSNARSSPNLFGSISKSDVSDEEDEEDDDIVELMTTSGRFSGSKGATFPRTSPGNSPLLTSRRSPTHYLTGSSDEELGGVFEACNKHRSKRMVYRKRSIPSKLVPMDSISSDDGISPMDFKRPARKDRILRLRPYNSLPATPAEHSGSESLTDLLDSMRKRSGSCRTDSSQSDGGGDKDMTNLATSIVTKFDLSDEEGTAHVAMEMEAAAHVTMETEARNGVLEPKRTSTTLRSVFCNIL